MPAKAATTEITLSDEKLRDMLEGTKGFRRDYPGETWVFMAEHKLFALLRKFAGTTRADERKRCLRACQGALNASDARSRIRALTDEPPITKTKGRQTK